MTEAPNGKLTFLWPTAPFLQDLVNFQGNVPETCKWIDSLSEDGVIFWDVGPNIGVFSHYTALRPNVTAQAFEPSAATFSTLVRNIELNGFGPSISAYCVALSDLTGWVSAIWKTLALATPPMLSQAVSGVTADGFATIFGAPLPTHIKMDVDGIEEKIILGGHRAFGAARSVMVEVFSSAHEPLLYAVTALGELGFFPDHESNIRNSHNHLFVNTRTLLCDHVRGGRYRVRLR